MPGQKSLAESKYYAHPQNSFWWIISHLIGFPHDANYDQTRQFLLDSPFGLWDVLYDCERSGSLDNNIERSSERANDFQTLFEDYEEIHTLAFNGIAARKIFLRHCNELIMDRTDIDLVQLPSTSPAHASLNRHQKLEQWQDKLGSNITNE